MPHPPTPLDARDFERHAAWLRRLAGRLVEDADVADDLVQETWLRAIIHRPGRHKPLRAWLTTVARSLARFHARGDRNRRRREERIARGERLDAGPADLVVRTEQLRIVVDALLALDEPYRSTLLLHFQEELGGNEIATRMAITPAAARRRLKDGLDRLRATLDARSGDRAAWVAALAPLGTTRRVTTTGGIGAVGGVAAILVITVTSATLWRAARPGEALESPHVESPPSHRLSATAESDSSGPSGVEPLERTHPPTDAAVSDREPTAPPGVDVSGRVIDEDGGPIPRAIVEVFTRHEEGLLESTGVLDHTDDDGRFSFTVRDPGERDLVVFAAATGRATGSAQRRSDREVTIRLPAAGVLFGRVLEFESRQPIEGAHLVFGYEHFDGPAGAYQWRSDGPAPLSTGVGGAYRFDQAPLGTEIAISVVRSAYARHTQRVTLVDAATELDLLVPRGFDVSGVVIDAETEALLSGATVLLDGGRTSCETGADGAFSARGLQADPLGILMLLDGYATTMMTVASSELTGDPLRVPAVRTCDVRGFVLDATGRPMVGASITTTEEHPRRPPLGDRIPGLADPRVTVVDSMGDVSSAVTDDRGRFQLTGLTPHREHVLEIRVKGAARLARVENHVASPRRHPHSRRDHERHLPRRDRRRDRRDGDPRWRALSHRLDLGRRHHPRDRLDRGRRVSHGRRPCRDGGAAGLRQQHRARATHGRRHRGGDDPRAISTSPTSTPWSPAGCSRRTARPAPRSR